MYRKLSRVAFGFVLFTVFIVTCACTTSSPLTQKSPLTVLGTVAETGLVEIVEARVVVSRGKHIVEDVVPVQKNEFQTTVQVPVGQWELTVLLADAEGIVRFQSKPQTIQIALAKPNTVELILRPADSKVRIVINLENYIFRHVAMRARIHVNEAVHEVTRSDSSIPLETVITMSPGSHEFKVELYTESFRATDRIGQGAWEVIHIAENEEVSITWSPETEALQISGRVETLLSAPSNLEAMGDVATGILVTWTHLNHWDTAGYFIFAQESLLERYQLLSAVPLLEPSYLHELDPEKPPAEIRYVVAAVSTKGVVGYYSHPQMWKQ